MGACSGRVLCRVQSNRNLPGKRRARGDDQNVSQARFGNRVRRGGEAGEGEGLAWLRFALPLPLASLSALHPTQHHVGCHSPAQQDAVPHRPADGKGQVQAQDVRQGRGGQGEQPPGHFHAPDPATLPSELPECRSRCWATVLNSLGALHGRLWPPDTREAREDVRGGRVRGATRTRTVAPSFNPGRVSACGRAALLPCQPPPTPHAVPRSTAADGLRSRACSGHLAVPLNRTSSSLTLPPPLSPPLQHNKEGDLWIIVDTAVYDVSDFADLHPGGSHVLLQVAGKGAFPLPSLEIQRTRLRCADTRSLLVCALFAHATRCDRGLLWHAPLRGPDQVLALPHRDRRRPEAPDRPPDQRHPVARPLRRANLAQRGLQVAVLPRLAPLAPEGHARVCRRRGARGRPDAREGRQAPHGRARSEDGLARDEPQRHGQSPFLRRLQSGLGSDAALSPSPRSAWVRASSSRVASSLVASSPTNSTTSTR